MQMSAQDFMKLLTNAGGDVSKIDLTGAEAPKLITDATTLFNTRDAIDGMITEKTPKDVKRVLSAARTQIDQILGEAAPGIKDLDAKYRELARQKDALDAGGNVLDAGKTAVWPQDNAAAVASGVQPEGSLVGPSASAFRLSQGARADIERIVGTKANDRVALAGIMQGEGDWNLQKLGQLFGPDKAAAMMKIVDQEKQMAGTENLAVNGSKTAAVTAAQADVNAPAHGPSAVRSIANFRLGDAAFNLADKITAGHASKVRAVNNQRIADVIMGKGDWQTTPGAAPTQMPLPVHAPVQQRHHADEIKAAVMRRRQ
jgi:hypothetical protein